MLVYLGYAKRAEDLSFSLPSDSIALQAGAGGKSGWMEILGRAEVGGVSVGMRLRVGRVGAIASLTWSSLARMISSYEGQGPFCKDADDFSCK